MNSKNGVIVNDGISALPDEDLAGHVIKSACILIFLLFLSFIIMSVLPGKSFAQSPDYQSFREDPIETAYRKLISHGEIQWDEAEMTGGGAPSLIKGMKWPLRTGELAGLFSRSSTKKLRRHMGIDIVAPKGTPVYAVLNGVVEVASNGGSGFRGYGKVIIINHSNQLWTLYSHCSTMEVKVGQPVKQGQKIARVGRTGRATTNHLHFEVRNAKGIPIDPLRYIPKDGIISMNLYRK